MGIDLPQDPAISALGIYPNDTSFSHKDIHSTMLVAVLFIISRNWKQARCHSTDGETWYIYTIEYYSDVKKNETMKFFGKWIELEKKNRAEWVIPEPEREICYLVIC